VFNVLKGHSAMYGTHPWHWYLSQGAPAVLGTSLPLLLVLPCLNRATTTLGLLALGGWTVLAYSLLAHKEFRFIMSLVPVASVLAGHALDLLLSLKKWRVLGRFGCAALLINLPALLWFCLIHQRGTLDVMTFLRSNITDGSSVFFLMPCHSTPYYSHIHRNIQMEFLECPPLLNAGDIDTQKEFYTDPERWLDSRYSASQTNLPTHIVMFDALVKEIESFLKLHNYQEINRVFHTLQPPESKIGTHIVVYHKNSIRFSRHAHAQRWVTSRAHTLTRSAAPGHLHGLSRSPSSRRSGSTARPGRLCLSPCKVPRRCQQYGILSEDRE
jgi:phosphatidylinositol glycan class B